VSKRRKFHGDLFGSSVAVFPFWGGLDLPWWSIVLVLGLDKMEVKWIPIGYEV